LSWKDRRGMSAPYGRGAPPGMHAENDRTLPPHQE